MANEYLKRTPTSTGNRKQWTWSGWVKVSDLSGAIGLFGSYHGGSSRYALLRIEPAGDFYFFTGNFTSGSSTTTNTWVNTVSKFRDFSGWMHITAVYNTTLAVEEDRFKLYVNGVNQDLSRTGSPPQNSITYVNSLYQHTLGAWAEGSSGGNQDFEGRMFDVFLVDGQALTPEVFGFYKDGDGYMSSGTTQATDFRPGQWSPHSPTKIKKDINRRGGFGVNGFYLPMNDSSNPGADFHCDPNSIITLKGEDLPQPRNGAPTTSDAFVSQVRKEIGGLGFAGCIKLDGNQGLSVADTAALDLGTGDFTIEGFYYLKDEGTYHALFDFRGSGGDGLYPALFKDATENKLYFYENAGVEIDDISMRHSEWMHVAICRSSGTTRAFVDGKLSGSFSDSNNYISRDLYIGQSNANSNDLYGFVSNFRIVKGTALYTANFTPPTEPLTAVTNTILLCANSTTSVTASTVTPSTISTIGSPIATTSELTGSIVLACPFVAGGFGQNGAANSTIPGLGDYHISLGGPSSVPAVNWLLASGTQATITGDKGLYYGSSLDVSSSSIRPRATVGTAFTPDGDYTVEFWVYINSFNSGGSHVIQYDTDAGQTGWAITVDSGTLRWLLRNTSNQDTQVSVANVVKSGQWNHIAGVYDSSKNLMTGYVNGVAVGSTPVASNYLSTQFTNLNRLHIGSNVGNGSRPMQGYLQDLRIYKGLAKYKGGFDVPKPYTPVGIEAFRTTPDTCKNNFATLNPLYNSSSGDVALVDGNLTYTGQQSPSYGLTQATTGVSSGKWYWEFRLGDTLGPNIGLGVMKLGTSSYSGTIPETSFISGVDGGIGFYHGVANNIYYWNGSSQLSVSYTIPACTTGDIISIALDLENGKIYYAKNGTWGNSGNPATGTNPVGLNLSGLYLPALSIGAAGSSNGAINFGQNSLFSGTTTAGTNADTSGKGLFKYAPPTGFLALCEDNLPTPAIADPGKHFKTVLYTGDGIAAHAITGVGFKPDLVWIKCRSNGDDHTLTDVVRGADRALYSNNTNQENVSSIRLQSFDDNGFTTGSSGDTNTSGRTFCAWCWKAGGAAVSNADGSITSQVSVNQTAGFSIVSYTANQTSGATVGHGLGKTPKMVIVKQRSGNTNNWTVYHEGTGNTKALYLDLTLNEGGNFTGAWNNTSPTSSVFSLGNSVETNRSSSPYIAYCWTEIEGYSKFGSYVGNSSNDGTFVYCGFKPAWVMIKVITSGTTNSWYMHDSSRNSTNPSLEYLTANSSTGGTVATSPLDMLSNGFKLRNGSYDGYNGAYTYIFAAFAESPFQTANAK